MKRQPLIILLYDYLLSDTEYTDELQLKNCRLQSAGRLVQENWFSLSLSLMLQVMVSQPVWLGIKHPPGTYNQIFITVSQLRVCWCGLYSLWREDRSFVYNYCWFWPPQSFLGQSLWNSWPYFTVSDLRLPFSSLPTTCRVMVEVFDPVSTWGNFLAYLLMLLVDDSKKN
jgi:hypothetical protein